MHGPVRLYVLFRSARFTRGNMGNEGVVRSPAPVTGNCPGRDRSDRAHRSASLAARNRADPGSGHAAPVRGSKSADSPFVERTCVLYCAMAFRKISGGEPRSTPE